MAVHGGGTCRWLGEGMAEARPRLKWDVQKGEEGLDEARAKIAVDASRVLEAAAEGERRSAEGPTTSAANHGAVFGEVREDLVRRDPGRAMTDGQRSRSRKKRSATRHASAEASARAVRTRGSARRLLLPKILPRLDERPLAAGVKVVRANEDVRVDEDPLGHGGRPASCPCDHPGGSPDRGRQRRAAPRPRRLPPRRPAR